MTYQLSRLRLNERYGQEINPYLSSQTTALYMCFETQGVDGVRDYLNRQASVEFARFHANYWRPVLLTPPLATTTSALAGSAMFSLWPPHRF